MKKKIQTYSLLGNKINVEITISDHKGVNYVHVHEDELASRESAELMVEKYGGILYSISQLICGMCLRYSLEPVKNVETEPVISPCNMVAFQEGAKLLVWSDVPRGSVR